MSKIKNSKIRDLRPNFLLAKTIDKNTFFRYAYGRMEILNGRLIAKNIRQKVKIMIENLPTKPGMAAILVGSDPASHLYVGLKEKACKKVGISFEKLLYPAEEPEENIIKKIHELNQRKDINGILVQLPLPNQDEDIVVYEISPNKDIDGFHPENLRHLENSEPGMVPPVALGIMKLIDSSHQTLKNKRAALVCSDIFARPLAALLKERGVESTIVHPDSSELKEVTLSADILIVAIGRTNFIKGSMIKKGAIVIDVGTNRTADGLVGDVEKETAESVAGYLTPVPGGVGPTTVAMLLVNVVKAYYRQIKN